MKAAFAIAVVLLMAGCSAFGGSANASPAASPKTTPLKPPSGSLDAEVPMPANFPSDVPIYPGARLTAGQSFTSSGQQTWGMEWETLDDGAKVANFYTTKLNQGDWQITSTTSPNGATAYTFVRKSNAHASGTLGIDGSSGVTKISMSLVNPTS